MPPVTWGSPLSHLRSCPLVSRELRRPNHGPGGRGGPVRPSAIVRAVGMSVREAGLSASSNRRANLRNAMKSMDCQTERSASLPRLPSSPSPPSRASRDGPGRQLKPVSAPRDIRTVAPHPVISAALTTAGTRPPPSHAWVHHACMRSSLRFAPRPGRAGGSVPPAWKRRCTGLDSKRGGRPSARGKSDVQPVLQRHGLGFLREGGKSNEAPPLPPHRRRALGKWLPSRHTPSLHLVGGAAAVAV